MSHVCARGAGLEEFRQHRHDVLNQLQIVRALIQMNRAERAIAVIDRLAEWLQSLGRVQQALVPGAEPLVWTLARCPHVVVDEVRIEEAPDQATLARWTSFFTDLEQKGASDGHERRVKLLFGSQSLRVELAADDLEIQEWQERYPQIRFVRR